MKQPRLVLRDIKGNYAIGGLADPSNVPAEIFTQASVHEPVRFRLKSVTPTMILYEEAPCDPTVVSVEPSPSLRGASGPMA